MDFFTHLVHGASNASGRDVASLDPISQLHFLQCSIRMEGLADVVDEYGLRQERRRQSLSVEEEEVLMRPIGNRRQLFSLNTNVSPIEANHSFSGIFSDIEAKGLEDVSIRGFTFGGEIGNFEIYWHAGGSCLECYRDESAWELIAEGFAAPSIGHEVILDPNREIIIRRGEISGFYIHSSVQSDRGLMYNSYNAAIAGEDSNLQILCGVARLGDTAFGGRGWYRQHRGFAGAILYENIPLFWSYRKHNQCPKPMRDAIFTILLCHSRSDCIIAVLPFDCLYAILEHLYWRDFIDLDTEFDNGKGLKSWARQCWRQMLRRMVHGRYSPLEDL